MNVTFVIHRYWLNLKRHKITFFVSFPIFGAMMILIGSIYTGPEIVSAIMNVPAFQALTGVRNIQNPGMLVWFLIFTNIFVLLFPAVGIFYGLRMLPFNERDGKELIFSTKMSPIIYFVENFIIVMILIPITASPIFLISVAYVGTASNDLTALAIANILPIFFVMVVAMVTVFGASIKSSSRWGLAFGGIFYLICFALNLIVSEVGSTSLNIAGYHIISLTDISLMSQMNIFQNALLGTWNENYILTCIVIIAILFVLTLTSLHITDYIEPRSSFVKKTYQPGEKSRNILSKFYFIRTPVESGLSRVGWRYPAFRDQLQSSAGFFIIYTIATTILVMVVLLVYPGDINMQKLFVDMKSSVLDNPVFASFMFGHTVQPNLEGFILLKLFLFNWLYYGPFLFVGTYYVVMRDKNDKYDEITWSLPRTRSSVLISRTGAMILYFWITIAVNWVGLWIGELFLSTYMDVTAPNISATIITFFFLALGYSLFLVFFIAIAVTVNSRYIIISLVTIFGIAIFVPMISNISKVTWLEYLSPFKYFDVVGLLVSQVNILGTAIPAILFGGIVAFILYFVGVEVIIPRKDIT
ncbi:MAG: hypothetical protein ACFFD1_06525 [Candidatus Thorarchaeota archaeon]